MHRRRGGGPLGLIDPAHTTLLEDHAHGHFETTHRPTKSVTWPMG